MQYLSVVGTYLDLTLGTVQMPYTQMFRTKTNNTLFIKKLKIHFIFPFYIPALDFYLINEMLLELSILVSWNIL